MLDLLDTENEYFQARRAFTNTDYDIQTAYARLYATQGELLNKIGSQRQGLPEINREAYMDAANVCQAVAPEQLNIDKAALLADAKPLTVGDRALPKPIVKAAGTCSAVGSVSSTAPSAAASAQQRERSQQSPAGRCVRLQQQRSN